MVIIIIVVKEIKAQLQKQIQDMWFDLLPGSANRTLGKVCPQNGHLFQHCYTQSKSKLFGENLETPAIPSKLTVDTKVSMNWKLMLSSYSIVPRY